MVDRIQYPTVSYFTVNRIQYPMVSYFTVDRIQYPMVSYFTVDRIQYPMVSYFTVDRIQYPMVSYFTVDRIWYPTVSYFTVDRIRYPIYHSIQIVKALLAAKDTFPNGAQLTWFLCITTMCLGGSGSWLWWHRESFVRPGMRHVLKILKYWDMSRGTLPIISRGMQLLVQDVDKLSANTNLLYIIGPGLLLIKQFITKSNLQN